MTAMYSLSWPWPEFSGDGAHPARAMLDQLSGLPILGWEASCRLSARGIETGRLLAGIARAQLSASRWDRLFEEIGVPEALRAAVAADLPLADSVYVACEQGAQAVTRKLYLECERGFRHRPGERLTILGYKWVTDPTVAASHRITEYWMLDHSDAKTSAIRLHDDSMGDTAAHRALARVAEAMANALAEALAMAGAESRWRHRHLTVREARSARASVAFNFYDSGLNAGALWDAAQALAAEWSLDADSMARLFDALATRELAWLAGGLDAVGEPFLTIYCVASQEDAIKASFSPDVATWGAA